MIESISVLVQSNQFVGRPDEEEEKDGENRGLTNFLFTEQCLLVVNQEVRGWKVIRYMV